MAHHLDAVQTLLSNSQLDALLLYGTEHDDPSYVSWILGAPVFETTFVVVTRSRTDMFVPRWRMTDAREVFRKTLAHIHGVPSKTFMMPTMLEFLPINPAIGYAGNVPYKELMCIPDATFVCLEDELNTMMAVKTAQEIDILKRAANTTRRRMSAFDWKSHIGRTERFIADRIQKAFGSKHPLGHLSLVTGSRTKQTSAALPSTRRLCPHDVICWDVGIRLHGYRSDLSDCVFLGNAIKYQSAYEKQKRAVRSTARHITDGTRSMDVPHLLTTAFTNVGLGSFLLSTDLGHGIGMSAHEAPDIGQDAHILRAGTVFTLEPDMRLPDGTLLRYEEMFYIGDDKKTRLLT